MATMLRFRPVRCGSKEVEINHQFSNEELVIIMLMPRVGKKLSFIEAYRLRWHELSYEGYLFSYLAMNIPLADWCRERGYYIEISVEDLDPSKRDSFQRSQ